MTRFHVSPKTGNPGACKATVACPFGDINMDHYNSAAAARIAYEDKQLSFPDTNSLPLVNREGKELKPLGDRQAADVEAMNEKEFKLYRRERVSRGKSHAQSVKAVEEQRDVFAEGFQNSTVARARAKTILTGDPAFKPLDVPHTKPEDKATRAGTSYSAPTDQPDGRVAMTVNGRTAVVLKNTKDGFPVEHDGTKIGTIKKRKDGKWSVDYGLTDGRPTSTSADAIAALLKKAGAGPAKPKTDAPPAAKKGHNPETSEIEHYSLRTNKDRTAGNLRRLSTPDLVNEYNRVTINKESAAYGSEIDSDESALKRIEGVLAERGERLHVTRYSQPRSGYDFGGPERFGLAPKDNA